jgi:pyridoxal phosphate enzyme (YggS family)
MSIAGNIAIIEERIQKACDLSGRKRGDVTFMGVSKFISIDMVNEAFCAGIRCFGESRVKEGIEKFDSFRKEHPEVEVHLIGSLQRNKAKTAAGFFDCIQSVDREELIIELEKFAGLKYPLPCGELSQTPDKISGLEVLLELHTGEESKSGFADFDSLFRAAEMVIGSKCLKAAGLMTMAPFTKDEELIRGSFRKLVKAQDELEKRFPSDKNAENWGCLSMGMSNDFEIAVEEGSTMLRIGSLVFKGL